MIKITSFGFLGKLPCDNEYIQYGIHNKEILQPVEQCQKNYLESNSTKFQLKISSYKNRKFKIFVMTKKSHDKSQRIHVFSIFIIMKVSFRNASSNYYMVAHLQKRLMKKLLECEYVSIERQDTKTYLISVIKSFLYEVKILY